MIRNTCPFLGLKEDPETALNFPSVGNFCHHASPVTQVKGAYQRKYCLTGEHVNCPLFQAATPLPPPAAIAVNSGLLAGPQKKWMVGLPVLLAGSAALFLAWNAFGAQLNLPFHPIPDTGSRATQSLSSFAIVGGAPDLKPALAPSLVPSATPEPSPTACPRPDNWSPYMVNPTDTLYRLSVVYGVSIEDLQRANCLGDNTLLKPGDIIFVPNLPTPTPTLTPTWTPVPPTNTAVPRQQDPVQPAPPQDNGNNDQPAPPPPTAVPPTAVPAQPQPTTAPQQPTNPPQDQKPPEQPKPDTKPPKQDKPPKVDPPPQQNPNPGDHNPRNNNGGNQNGNGNGKGKGHKGGG